MISRTLSCTMINCYKCKSTENLYVLQCSHHICLDCLVSGSKYSYDAENHRLDAVPQQDACHLYSYLPSPLDDEDRKRYFVPIPYPENNQVQCRFCLHQSSRRHVLQCSMRPLFCPLDNCAMELFPYLFSQDENSYNRVLCTFLRRLFPSIVAEMVYEDAGDEDDLSARSKSAFYEQRQPDGTQSYWWQVRKDDDNYTLAFKYHLSLGECKAITKCSTCHGLLRQNEVDAHAKLHDTVTAEINETVSDMFKASQGCQTNESLEETCRKIKKARMTLSS